DMGTMLAEGADVCVTRCTRAARVVGERSMVRAWSSRVVAVFDRWPINSPFEPTCQRGGVDPPRCILRCAGHGDELANRPLPQLPEEAGRAVSGTLRMRPEPAAGIGLAPRH